MVGYAFCFLDTFAPVSSVRGEGGRGNRVFLTAACPPILSYSKFFVLFGASRNDKAAKLVLRILDF